MSASSSSPFGPREWMRHPQLLEPNEGHILVSVVKKDAVTISQTHVDDKGLLPMIQASGSSSACWKLELLITKRTGHVGDDRRQPYPAEILDALMEHWKVTDICFHAQARTGSSSVRFHPVPGNPAHTGLIIRMVYGLPFRGTLMIAHNESTQTTQAVCFGITSEHAQKLLIRLEQCQSEAFFPLHVAYLLCDIALRDLEQFSTYTYYDFVSVREAMGTNLYLLSGKRTEDALDLVDLPRRLTGLANALASNCSSLKGVSGVVDSMESYFRDTQANYDIAYIDLFADRLNLTRQIVESSMRRNEYVQESVQAQVQMVYALLAQKDNELSHQYGADMRVISIVTLVFLPGTFVATLFSTSFWDFGPSNEGPLVSKWIWLYCVVTAVLTICVISIWTWWPLVTNFNERQRRPLKGIGELMLEWKYKEY